MKKYILLGFVSLLWGNVNLFGQVEKANFTFPFNIGDHTWQQYATNKERAVALQIPEMVLPTISTKELLDLCLNYPFLLEFTFSDDYQVGLNKLMKNFNGFEELLKRTDLIEAMLNKDKDLEKDIQNVLKKEGSLQGFLSFQNLALELLFFNKYIFHRITDCQKKELLEIYNKNKQIKSLYPDIFGVINNLPDDYFTFSNMDLLSSKGQKSYPSYQSKTIYTPNGSLVPDTWYLTSGDVSYTDSQIAAWSTYIYNTYQEAQLLQIHTYKFNNSGYTWYTSDHPSDPVVIGRSNAYADTVYWADASYIEVPETIATKVVYDRRGFHSAVRESSEWYVSKWGHAGPLVRHHPNAIPDGSGQIDYNYYPNSMNRKYYILNPNCSINGSQLINGGTASYSVVNLPTGWTVTWSLSDSYYNQNCLQEDYPSTNQCTITYSSGHEMFPGILTASIKYSGTTILSVTKNIYAFTGFKGTYISSMGSGQYTAPNPIYTGSNTSVHIFSPKLIGATVTYTGDAIPSYWLQGDNTIDLRMPSSGSTIVVQVHCSTGDIYYIPIIRFHYLYQMSVSQNGESVTVTLDESVIDNQVWTLEVYNTTTGKKIATQNIVGRSVTFNISDWKRDLYVVRAIVDKEVLTEKMQIR